MNTQTIEIDTIPFMIGEAHISKIEIRPCTFVELVKMASSLPVSGRAKALKRAQIKLQAKFLDASGKAIPIDDKGITQMPIKYGKLLSTMVEQDDAPRGKVIKKGDGITDPILFQLGTPLTTSGASITELEFSAKTFGDVEDIVSLDGDLNQTLAMIETIGCPIGGDVTLLRLPSWALEAMRAPDGLALMQEVLPNFTE